MIELGLGIGVTRGEGGDTTPGGAESALLLEDAASGLLLEDGTYLLLEA